LGVVLEDITAILQLSIAAEEHCRTAEFSNQILPLLQEATASEMELHDDDPDHFEIALKFMYTLEYDAAAIDTKVGAAQNLKKMIIIGLYTVADKYDVHRLIVPAGNQFNKIFIVEADHDVLETVIRAYSRIS
jgi:hypothetical protein